METIVDLTIRSFNLMDFAPFISVAIAVNFVYSFWSGVKDKTINNFNEKTDNFIQELNSVYTSGNCNQSSTVNNLKTQADGYGATLTSLSLISTVTGLIIVFILFVILGFLGFAPTYKIPLSQGVLLITLSLAPSTLLRVFGLLYSNWALKQLNKTSSIMKEAAKSAIKDNQQAAYQQPR